MDLSVIIPARNERFLRNTVEDVLAHSQASTEIIVIADGALPVEPLAQDPRVTVVLLAESIGQRAATNLGARLARGRYLMKLDAHCSVAPGFDVELLRAADELGREVVQIPAQKNLHVYDRRCRACGHTVYQGPIPDDCPSCKSRDLEMVMVWKPRRGTTTTSWTFDEHLKFQYDSAGRRAQQGDICEVMTSLGACFFMDRGWFLELGGFDEAIGSWGQFGQELACKAWLSGGSHVVNKRTWYAHFFRVGGIGFPYPMTHAQQERAREYSRALWRGNAWPGQVRPLRWLVEKFEPAGWSTDGLAALPAALPPADGPRLTPALLTKARRATKYFEPLPPEGGEDVDFDASGAPRAGVVFYSDGRLDRRLAELVRMQLRAGTLGLSIVAVSLPGAARLDGARNVEMRAPRGVLTMFRQILQGLELLDTEVAFLCEHDVLYDPSHFDFRPICDDTFYYNENVWKIDAQDQTRPVLHYPVKQTSGLCASRALLVEHYRKRIERVEREGRYDRRIGFEPGTHRFPRGIDDHPAEGWMSAAPNVDVRHGGNLTPSRWRRDQFRDQRYTRGWTEAAIVPCWGTPAEILGGIA